MISEKHVTKNMASWLFETSIIEKFKTCFEEEISHNTHFQYKLSQLSGLEFDNFQGSEFFMKRMIESSKEFSGCQFDEMKENLFKKFNIVLNGVRNHLKEDTKEFKHF